MKLDELLKRISGFSVPIFGVSWTPPESEVTIARRVIAFLEDRRVLYNPSDMQDPIHCTESVLQMRSLLTSELGAIETNRPLAQSLRAMRGACRKFLDTVGVSPTDTKRKNLGYPGFHRGVSIFNGALGELRGVFGVHIAILAAEYGLDIEHQLARILPSADDEDA